MESLTSEEAAQSKDPASTGSIDPDTDKYAFVADENVFAYHGDKLYAAKILRRRMAVAPGDRSGKKQPLYRIHYKGWKDRWDEWVVEGRMLKDTPENAVVAKASRATKKQRIAASSTASSSSSSTSTANSAESTTEAKTRPSSIRVNMPENLKQILINDAGLVMGKKFIVTLPRTPSVASILEAQLKTRAPHNKHEEIIKGFIEYFDRALGTLLLYRLERPQYKAVLTQHPTIPLSQMYGAEHLLRLFVQLPKLLTTTYMPARSKQSIGASIQAVLSFMDENRDSLFSVSVYTAATPEYIKLAF